MRWNVWNGHQMRMWLALTVCAVLAAGRSDGALRGAINTSFWPRHADTRGRIALYTKAERLGFNEPGARAQWPLRDVSAGNYHIVLTYSAGHALGGRPSGVICVSVGERSYPVKLPATGGWGLLQNVTVKDVQLKPGDGSIKVRLDKREPGVKTVLDLWRVDLVDPRAALPGAGEAVAKKSAHGWYVQYIPYTAREPIRVLVSVHGTPGKGVDLVKAFTADPSRVARDYMSVAHDQGLILILPVFDTPNFGGYAGPMGGYRGLFGRHIRADEFVNEILDGYKETYPGYDGRLYLHGHSAGGQFANRYVIMNPDRVLGAVVSSAGTFAYPEPDHVWPAGMRPLKRSTYWPGDKAPREVVVVPDPEGWLRASMLPVAVVVGDLERTPRPKPNPMQKGNNTVENSECWVKDMQAYAEAHGKKSRMRLFIVKDCGHSGHKLAPTGFQYLFGN